ncbi:MAG: PhzF family phenazine biosynthesis protein [Oscillospiraceae bacterium]|nr:PhzF family phenazine biosynthesis protein [Oscillospiraceae bacterium]
MELCERPGGCLPGLPIKLALWGEPAPELPGDTLTVLADCAALLQKEWSAATVTVCPRVTGDMTAALRALSAAGDFRCVRVIAPDVPCCAGLAEHVAAALPERKLERVLLPVSVGEPEPEPAPAPAPADVSPIRAETSPAPVSSLRFYPAAAFSPDAEPGVAAAFARRFPAEEDMALSAEKLRRETVFIRPERDGSLTVRAFAPAGELQPGPAAILAAAGMLRARERQLGSGTYNIRTVGGFVQINVGEELVWIEHAAGPLRRMLNEEERAALYAALGLPDRETEIRPCLAGDAAALLELPEGEELSSVSAGESLAAALEKTGASGICLYRRTGAEETAEIRSFGPEGDPLPPGRGAGLLGWWLPLLRRAGAECVFREEDREYRTFTGPDGRLFLGGRVSSGASPIRGEELFSGCDHQD